MTNLLRSKLFWTLIGMGAIVLLLCYSPLGLLFDRDFLSQWLDQLGLWAVVIYLVVFIGATMVGIPGTVLVLVGGVVFGLVWGVVWAMVGATVGAVGAFWLARYLLHDWATTRFSRYKLLAALNKAVTQRPFMVVLAVRFAPLSPFNLVNFLFGLTPIRVEPYALATFLGILPGTIVYVWLGITGEQALHGEDPWPFVGAFGLLSLLTLTPLLLQRHRFVTKD